MRLGIYPYDRRQPLRWLDVFPSNQSSIVYTPKQDFMASRMLVDCTWTLTGASLTAFQNILSAINVGAATFSQKSSSGRDVARRLFTNANFRSQFTDPLNLNFNLYGNVPCKNQVNATDLMLRDMIFCGVNPFIEFNNSTGFLRIAFWIHFERPFMNESATIFSVKNQNTIRVDLPNLTSSGGSVNLYYAAGVVEQRYLFFEGGRTIQGVAPIANIAIDESSIQSVYMYDNAQINNITRLQTYANGVLVDDAFPEISYYNSSLDAHTYPVAHTAIVSGSYVSGTFDYGFWKVFEHPVLNLPTTSNKNRNILIQVALNSNQNLRYFYTKILETDAARLESEQIVQNMQGVFSR
jgi:hypothetical protein